MTPEHKASPADNKDGGKVKTFKCRNYARTKSWIEYTVAHAAIAAELYAEHTWAEDGSVITVMNHGKYRIGRRVVVYKIENPPET